MQKTQQTLFDDRNAEMRGKTTAQEPQKRQSLFIPRSEAGISINHETFLKFAAIWSCVRLISETIAKLPRKVKRHKKNGGSEDLLAHGVRGLLNQRPNEEMTAISFWETIVAWALTWGNGYAEIERDRVGRPIALWLIEPWRVTLERDKRTKRLFYNVSNDGQDDTQLAIEDMFHLHGLGDGLIGISVIDYASRTASLGLAMEQSGISFFANDQQPAFILEHPKTLSKDAHERLRESLERRHRGVRNKYNAMILEEDMKAHAMSMPFHDAQWVEGRKFGILDVCRWFRVPPHKVYELDRAILNNIGEQQIDFVSDTLDPWTCRIEQECDTKLFTGRERNRVFVKHNLNALLRGSHSERADFYERMSHLGVFSINEVREKEDLNPIGPEGDQRFVPLNFTTLENAVKAQESVPQADVDDEFEPEVTRQPTVVEPSVAAHLPAPAISVEMIQLAFSDRINHICRRERREYASARKRWRRHGDDDRWLSKYYSEARRNYFHELLVPLKGVVQAAVGGDGNNHCGQKAISALKLAVFEHCEASVDSISAAPETLEAIDARTQRFASDLSAMLAAVLIKPPEPQPVESAKPVTNVTFQSYSTPNVNVDQGDTHITQPKLDVAVNMQEAQPPNLTIYHGDTHLAQPNLDVAVNIQEPQPPNVNIYHGDTNVAQPNVDVAVTMPEIKPPNFTFNEGDTHFAGAHFSPEIAVSVPERQVSVLNNVDLPEQPPQTIDIRPEVNVSVPERNVHLTNQVDTVAPQVQVDVPVSVTTPETLVYNDVVVQGPDAPTVEVPITVEPSSPVIYNDLTVQPAEVSPSIEVPVHVEPAAAVVYNDVSLPEPKMPDVKVNTIVEAPNVTLHNEMKPSDVAVTLPEQHMSVNVAAEDDGNSYVTEQLVSAMQSDGATSEDLKEVLREVHAESIEGLLEEIVGDDVDGIINDSIGD